MEALDFEVWGANALFTDPIFRAEKQSYPVPTHQALVGVVSSIYWKPTLIWHIDKVRIMNQVEMETKSVRPLDKTFSLDHNSLAFYTYLHAPRYQVRCHFEWNMERDDLAVDRNEKKHLAIFKRALKAGGRRDIFLGTRECQAYVKPAHFGDDFGVYDDTGRVDFGQMFYGYHYPDEHAEKDFSVALWDAFMDRGVITFPRLEDCTNVQKIRDVEMQPYDVPKLTQSVDKLYSELGEEAGQ